MNMKKMTGKTVFVTGGSGGLGKEIAKIYASSGAHVTIFARNHELLDAARQELLSACKYESQEINVISLDLAEASEVDAVFNSQPRTADILYCSAGGCRTECGFVNYLKAEDLDSCMRNNYFTSAYTAQTMLKIWERDDQRSSSSTQKLRQIVFINSGLSFIPIPGYGAYIASKCAVRGLADTLRIEALRLTCSASRYTIHCAFPGNFISPAFIQEQENKPDLAKKIEGTTAPIEELKKSFPSAHTVGRQIISQVNRGEFAIAEDSWESSLLFANMVGPSPKRGWGLFDSFFAIVIGLFVWPILRRRFDRLAIRDRKK